MQQQNGKNIYIFFFKSLRSIRFFNRNNNVIFTIPKTKIASNKSAELIYQANDKANQHKQGEFPD